MDIRERSLREHEKWRGKIETGLRAEVKDRESLALAYTPGVAQPCLEIKEHPERVNDLTRKWNTVAVVSDGSAVLGLGNIGPEAGLPVMEGKCALFKAFGDVDAVPIVLATQDTDEIVRTVKAIAPSFGGINLEDISAPRCFEIERRLKEELDIPVFHDDQHGTAVIVLAGLINALKLAGKKAGEIRVAMSGPGAAGTAIAKLLLAYGVKDIVMCDEYGTLYEGRDHMDWAKQELAGMTNRGQLKGTLKDAVAGSDVFIGVSVPNVLTEEMVGSMNRDAIVFAMANPTPEIFPDAALRAGALVAATGRSDFPNQINNVLAFPGIFRGAFDVQARQITEEMKLAAAESLAGLISEKELNPEYVIPDPFDPRVPRVVAEAVAKNACRG